MTWHLKGNPHSVQMEALKRAEGRTGYAYNLEQGLGKTALVLNEFVGQQWSDIVTNLIVICPNSLKVNWRAEAENWGVNIPVILWPERPTKPGFIWVINYEAMLHEAYDECLSWIRRFRTMVVLDESQRIKNPQAKTTKRILSLRNEIHIRRTLSGTPLTNSIMDLHPQLTFIGALNMNPYQFRNRFAVMGGYMMKQVMGTKNEEELHDILDRYTFRATKDNWLDLPEQIYPHPREISLHPEQRRHYDTMLRDLYVLLGDVGEDQVIPPVLAKLAVTQLGKLQQISSGFIIDEEGKTHDLVEPAKNPKIKDIKDILDEIPGKAIIFCRHKHAVTLLLDQLEAYGCARLVGGMSDCEVAEEKARFNCAGGAKVLVSQASVGGVGHTLLGGPGADRCSTTIYFENSFSLGDRLQSEARNHRSGQDKAVVYWDFVSSPVDAKVIKALQQKRDLVAALIDRD